MLEMFGVVKNDKVTVNYDLIEDTVVVLCKSTHQMRIFIDDAKDLFFEFAYNFNEETDFETAVQFFKPVNI